MSAEQPDTESKPSVGTDAPQATVCGTISRLDVMVSSVMPEDLLALRQRIVAACAPYPFLRAWAFEHAPAAAEAPEVVYRRVASTTGILVLLVAERASGPVMTEVRDAIRRGARVLVFALPTSASEPETEQFLSDIRDTTKYLRVDDLDALPRLVLAAIFETMVQSTRDEPPLRRAATLERLILESRRRMVARWQATGLSATQAEVLESSVGGALPAAYLPSGQQPLRILVGEIGVGKSILAERAFQEFCRAALKDPEAPVPILLKGRHVEHGLRALGALAPAAVGDPEQVGTALVIDEADGNGRRALLDLIEEARGMTALGARSRIILTCRPSGVEPKTDERVDVPALDEDGASDLVSHVAGREVMPAEIWSLSESMRSALHRPLFAILFGLHLRRSSEHPSRITSVELLDELVASALASENLQAAELLERVAVMAMDGRGSVADVREFSAAEIEPLVESRLIEREGSTLAFSLPIFGEWFAAQALRRSEALRTQVIADPQRRVRWRASLTLAITTGSPRESQGVSAALVRTDVGLAAQILTDGVASWSADGATLTRAALVYARELQSAVRDWAVGLGPALSVRLLPVDGTGEPRTIGVATRDDFLTIAFARNEVGVIQEVTSDDDLRSLTGRWGPWSHGRVLDRPAWAWRWALDHVQDRFDALLKSRALPVTSSVHARELAWKTALVLLDHGEHWDEPIELTALERALARVGTEPEKVVDRRRSNAVALAPVRQALADAQGRGMTHMTAPWPSPDLEHGPWLWSDFSPERLLERTRAVYAGAIEVYASFLVGWFAPLALQLDTALAWPARLAGRIEPAVATAFGDAPIMWWRWEPLPRDDVCEVAIELGPRYDMNESLLREYRRLRPETIERLRISQHAQLLDTVFGATPASDIAYAWLRDDLRDLRLV